MGNIEIYFIVTTLLFYETVCIIFYFLYGPLIYMQESLTNPVIVTAFFLYYEPVHEKTSNLGSDQVRHNPA